MRHHIFKTSLNCKYPIAVLSNSTAFVKQEIEKHYIKPLVQSGIEMHDLIAFTLEQNISKKVPVSFIKEYIDKLLPELNKLDTKIIYVASAPYFKVLANKVNVDPYFGYIVPCAIKGYEYIQVVLGINYQQLIYNPDLQSKLDLSLKVIVDHLNNSYTIPGTGIIHSEYYPESIEDIKATLNNLHQYPSLTCDIEGFSLKFFDAKIATIAFAHNEHNGIAFACDALDYYEINLDNQIHAILGNEVIETPYGKQMTIKDYYNELHKNT